MSYSHGGGGMQNKRPLDSAPYQGAAGISNAGVTGTDIKRSRPEQQMGGAGMAVYGHGNNGNGSSAPRGGDGGRQVARTTLPRRPGADACTQYRRTGVSKYGTQERFDHSPAAHASGSGVSSAYGPGSSSLVTSFGKGSSVGHGGASTGPPPSTNGLSPRGQPPRQSPLQHTPNGQAQQQHQPYGQQQRGQLQSQQQQQQQQPYAQQVPPQQLVQGQLQPQQLLGYPYQHQHQQRYSHAPQESAVQIASDQPNQPQHAPQTTPSSASSSAAARSPGATGAYNSNLATAYEGGVYGINIALGGRGTAPPTATTTLTQSGGVNPYGGVAASGTPPPPSQSEFATPAGMPASLNSGRASNSGTGGYGAASPAATTPSSPSSTQGAYGHDATETLGASTAAAAAARSASAGDWMHDSMSGGYKIGATPAATPVSGSTSGAGTCGPSVSESYSVPTARHRYQQQRSAEVAATTAPSTALQHQQSGGACGVRSSHPQYGSYGSPQGSMTPGGSATGPAAAAPGAGNNGTTPASTNASASSPPAPFLAAASGFGQEITRGPAATAAAGSFGSPRLFPGTPAPAAQSPGAPASAATSHAWSAGYYGEQEQQVRQAPLSTSGTAGAAVAAAPSRYNPLTGQYLPYGSGTAIPSLSKTPGQAAPGTPRVLPVPGPATAAGAASGGVYDSHSATSTAAGTSSGYCSQGYGAPPPQGVPPRPPHVRSPLPYGEMPRAGSTAAGAPTSAQYSGAAAAPAYGAPGSGYQYPGYGGVPAPESAACYPTNLRYGAYGEQASGNAGQQQSNSAHASGGQASDSSTNGRAAPGSASTGAASGPSSDASKLSLSSPSSATVGGPSSPGGAGKSDTLGARDRGGSGSVSGSSLTSVAASTAAARVASSFGSPASATSVPFLSPPATATGKSDAMASAAAASVGAPALGVAGPLVGAGAGPPVVALSPVSTGVYGIVTQGSHSAVSAATGPVPAEAAAVTVTAPGVYSAGGGSPAPNGGGQYGQPPAPHATPGSSAPSPYSSTQSQMPPQTPGQYTMPQVPPQEQPPSHYGQPQQLGSPSMPQLLPQHGQPQQPGPQQQQQLYGQPPQHMPQQQVQQLRRYGQPQPQQIQEQPLQTQQKMLQVQGQHTQHQMPPPQGTIPADYGQPHQQKPGNQQAPAQQQLQKQQPGFNLGMPGAVIPPGSQRPPGGFNSGGPGGFPGNGPPGSASPQNMPPGIIVGPGMMNGAPPQSMPPGVVVPGRGGQVTMPQQGRQQFRADRPMPKLPQRANVADCSNNVEHGSCRFGPTGKYNHPYTNVGQRFEDHSQGGSVVGTVDRAPCDVFLNESAQGISSPDSSMLPKRPGLPPCGFFARTGKCAFGMKCKFDHPTHANPTPGQLQQPRAGGGYVPPQQPQMQWPQVGRAASRTPATSPQTNKAQLKVPSEVTARHILVKHKGSRRPTSWQDPGGSVIKMRTPAQATSILRGMRGGIKTLNDFSKVAMSKSDCSSAKRGGDLGSFGRGKMQRAFEDAAFGLQIGAVSNVVSTDSGMHLIMRTA